MKLAKGYGRRTGSQGDGTGTGNRRLSPGNFRAANHGIK